MTPDDYCLQKAAIAGSSLYYGLIFLPESQQRSIRALYALRAELMHVVEETSDPEVALRQLDWWRSQIDKVFDGEPEHPVGKALAFMAKSGQLPQELLLELIDGIQMDLQQGRYADFKSLQLYCYRVSGVLNTLMAEICGYADRASLKYAHELGIALQLSHIIQNAGEHARMGRIYLPVADLQEFNVPANDILAAKETENFRRLLEFEIQRTETHFEQAMSLLPAIDRKAQRFGLALAAIHRATLAEIRRGECRVLSQRTALTPIRKLWIASRTWLKA